MGKAPADRYASMEEMKADLFALDQELTEDAPDTQAATKIQRQHAPNNDVSGASTDPAGSKQKIPTPLMASGGLAIFAFLAAFLWWNSGNHRISLQ